MRLWLRSMVSGAAQPITTPLEPPVKPTNWCGSTWPITSLSSAAAYAALMRTGVPRRVAPKSRMGAERASWATTAQPAAIPAGRMRSMADRSAGGCRPPPT